MTVPPRLAISVAAVALAPDAPYTAGMETHRLELQVPQGDDRVRPRVGVVAALLAVMLLGMSDHIQAGGGAGGSTAGGTPLTAAEVGAHYGQAKGVAAFCPGGRLTPRAETLPSTYQDEARRQFELEAARVEEQWRQALSCREADPETGRMLTRCRRIKVLSCRQAWVEIGPEGVKLPGLIVLEPGESRDAR